MSPSESGESGPSDGRPNAASCVPFLGIGSTGRSDCAVSHSATSFSQSDGVTDGTLGLNCRVGSKSSGSRRSNGLATTAGLSCGDSGANWRVWANPSSASTGSKAKGWVSENTGLSLPNRRNQPPSRAPGFVPSPPVSFVCAKASWRRAAVIKACRLRGRGTSGQPVPWSEWPSRTTPAAGICAFRALTTAASSAFAMTSAARAGSDAMKAPGIGLPLGGNRAPAMRTRSVGGKPARAMAQVRDMLCGGGRLGGPWGRMGMQNYSPEWPHPVRWHRPGAILTRFSVASVAKAPHHPRLNRRKACR